MGQDLEGLQGTWNVVSLEMDGQKMSGGGARIVVRGNRFTTSAMGAAYEGTVTVRGTPRPRVSTCASSKVRRREIPTSVFTCSMETRGRSVWRRAAPSVRRSSPRRAVRELRWKPCSARRRQMRWTHQSPRTHRLRRRAIPRPNSPGRGSRFPWCATGGVGSACSNTAGGRPRRTKSRSSSAHGGAQGTVRSGPVADADDYGLRSGRWSLATRYLETGRASSSPRALARPESRGPANSRAPPGTAERSRFGLRPPSNRHPYRSHPSHV